ncbi:MAG: hypothetical protein AAF653_08490, partial [Chloroflexota bacterium]
LVRVLDRYGDEGGEPVVVLLLQNLRERAGDRDRDRIDTLITALGGQILPLETSATQLTQSTPSPVGEPASAPGTVPINSPETDTSSHGFLTADSWTGVSGIVAIITLIVTIPSVIVAVIALRPAGGDPATPTPAPSITATAPDIAPTVAVVESTDIPTLAPPPSTEAPATVVITAAAITITLQRSGSAVGIGADADMDLSTLTFDFGMNTRYTLGNDLPASASHTSGQVWCLRLDGEPFPVPADCAATAVVESSTPLRSTWRNNTLTVLLNGNHIGTCEAQPTNSDIYVCTFEVPDA